MSLVDFAKQHNIRYFLIHFTDVFGTARAKLVPASGIAQAEENGVDFAGFSAQMDLGVTAPDLTAKPDAATAIALPWQPEVGWVIADLWLDGALYRAAPRQMLKEQIARMAERELRPKTGIECEFFLLNEAGCEPADQRDRRTKPCFEQAALMRSFPVLREICDYLESLGWKPYQIDHEDGTGQFELNWEYDDALITADRHVLFKLITKAVAEKHGMTATFMPKPFAPLAGNGCHCHVSIWDPAGKKNLFIGNGPNGLAPPADQFLAGVLREAAALCGWFAPTVNSYKRLNSKDAASGVTWSPQKITYGGNNRTHLVRIPADDRLEFRLMDGAANPYLLQAGLLAAGLDGILHQRDPGERLDLDMYTQAHQAATARPLPDNLLDALRALKQSELLRNVFGQAVIDGYVAMKRKEWETYSQEITDWERANTLDC